LGAGDGGRLRIDDLDLEVSSGCCREKNEKQKRSAKCAHNHPPFHAKGVKVDGLRRSPGFASEEALAAIAVGQNIRILQTAFPGLLPVTGCDFLAYSCAAARELHPLPCLRHEGKDAQTEGHFKERK
jgi:hypothetical protein